MGLFKRDDIKELIWDAMNRVSFGFETLLHELPDEEAGIPSEILKEYRDRVADDVQRLLRDDYPQAAIRLRDVMLDPSKVGLNVICDTDEFITCGIPVSALYYMVLYSNGNTSFGSKEEKNARKLDDYEKLLMDGLRYR